MIAIILSLAGSTRAILGNGYRVYNPVLYRFHVPNPSSPFATGEINSYAYCTGDPVNRVEPSGQSSFFGPHFDWKDLITTIAAFTASVLAGILTAGVSSAIQIGVGIAVGIMTSTAAGAVGDLADGRKPPTWKSAATDALNGLVDGFIGEFGGRLLSKGFKMALNFKTLVGRAGSYTLHEVLDHSFSTVFKDAVKEAFPSELMSYVAEGLVEIDPIPPNPQTALIPPSPVPRPLQRRPRHRPRRQPHALPPVLRLLSSLERAGSRRWCARRR